MGLDQRRAPLLAAVLRASRSGALRLHTPTHRGRVDREYGAALGAALALDLTELDETDDLRDPRGAIAQAQELAAAHFGADRTWFLVNGASAGNCAALLAIAGRATGRVTGRDTGPLADRLPDSLADRTRKVVVGRDSHVSIVNGLILADLEPVWVPAGWDARWGVVMPPTAAAYASTIAAHPDAMAVVVTSPSYFGDPADVAGIRAAAGDRVLIVDEAHGAHIPRALAAGADLVVHSAHKGLSGPTQGGYLHLRGDRVDPEHVSAALRLLQSTSPSYWILAGLDAARRESARETVDCRQANDGGAATDCRASNGGRAARDAQETVETRKTLDLAGLAVRPAADLSRIVVRFADGFAAYDALSGAGIVAEAALPGGVLFLATGLARNEATRLAAACKDVMREQIRLNPGSYPPGPVPGPPRSASSVMPLRAAALAPQERLLLSGAAGRVCAEAICPYPPGIPVLVPGEVVSSEAQAFLARVAPGLDLVTVVTRGFERNG